MAEQDNILPISISGIDHIAAFDAIVSARMDALELEVLLVYVIDTVDESALYYLADQFGVLGYAGWKQAQTESEKRETIKQAINLHRKKGTVWAVKEAMRLTGYADAELRESIRHWAEFSIITDAGAVVDFLDNDSPLINLVNEYKNARSHLVGTSFSENITEDSLPDEILKIKRMYKVTDSVSFEHYKLDGSQLLDGSRLLEGYQGESLDITITHNP